MKMNWKWIPIAFVIGMVAGGVFVWAATQQVARIHCTVTIKAVGVGVYADAQCTIPVSTINWGVMEPGETKGITVFIRNEGNVPSTLNIATESWSPPEAEQHIIFTNDYDGRTVNPMETVQVLFTLYVKPTISGIEQFSFDILVTIKG